MIFGKGTSFTWNGAAIKKLTNIGNPKLSIDSKEKTTHDSATRFREFFAGLVDAGAVPISGLFDETDTAGQHAMYADAAAGTEREFVIAGPNSEFTFTCNGFITSIEPVGSAPTDDGLSFAAEIKITGAPTLAISTSAGLTTPFFAISESAVIVPAPAAATYDYVATVLTGVSSVTVTPTASAGTITVDGNTVTSGEASSAIALGAAGSVTEATIVVTETNKAPKTYTIRIARAAS